MKLRATTLLAENTDPILRELVGHLDSSGVDVEFDESLDSRERQDLVAADAIDLVWACGLLTAELIDGGLGLDVVAAPVFPGESKTIYRSVVVSRAEMGQRSFPDLLTGRLAVNEYGSWSGWHAYRVHVSERGHSVDEHPTLVLTGSHRNSVLAVLEQVADVASIDSSLWEHLCRTMPEVGELSVVDATRDWPAPPISVGAGLAKEIENVLRQVLNSEEWFDMASVENYRAMLEISRS